MNHEITFRDANPAVFRRQFGNTIQQVVEDIQNFAAQLEQMALDCEFSSTCRHYGQDTIYTEFQQRDQLMQDLRDDYIRKEAYARAKLYPQLHDMVHFCAEMEHSTKDMAAIAGNHNTHSVDAVNMAKSGYAKQKLKKAKQPKSDSTTHMLHLIRHTAENIVENQGVDVAHVKPHAPPGSILARNVAGVDIRAMSAE